MGPLGIMCVQGTRRNHVWLGSCHICTAYTYIDIHTRYVHVYVYTQIHMLISVFYVPSCRANLEAPHPPFCKRRRLGPKLLEAKVTQGRVDLDTPLAQ